MHTAIRGDSLVAYTIHDSRMVNECLYAFLITYNSIASEEGYSSPTTTWTYVAWVDGEWRVITSNRNIPEEIKDGYDSADFTIPENFETIPPESYVDPTDVLLG